MQFEVNGEVGKTTKNKLPNGSTIEVSMVNGQAQALITTKIDGNMEF